MSLNRKNQHGKGNTGSILFVIILSVLAYVGFLYWVPYWEYLTMGKIMGDAALTYQVTGSLSAAQEELGVRMREEHISFDIAERDCIFHEGSSQLSIECEWVATMYIDLPNKRIDLSRPYRRYISVNSNGIIEDR